MRSVSLQGRGKDLLSNARLTGGGEGGSVNWQLWRRRSLLAFAPSSARSLLLLTKEYD